MKVFVFNIKDKSFFVDNDAAIIVFNLDNIERFDVANYNTFIILSYLM